MYNFILIPHNSPARKTTAVTLRRDTINIIILYRIINKFIYI